MRGDLRTEPDWPDEPGPHLFLFEASGRLELRLLEDWIDRHSPTDVDAETVQRATLPQTRRRRRRRRQDPRLEAFLDADEDPVLIPLRVVWFPARGDGTSGVGLRDVLTPGDPRDPNTLRQYAISRMQPGRCGIIAGESSRVSWLRKEWIEPSGRGQTEGHSMAEFVAMRAWLALERAERLLRGNRYKVPKFPRESLVDSKAFARGVAALARDAGTSYERMAARTRRYVKEIAATHSPYVIDIAAGGFRWLIGKAYVGIHADEERLATIYAESQQHPLVFLPSHKSNFDHLTLLYVLYRNGLPPNHTAGGINMNFFPVGAFLRRSGVFFIRREFRDNAPYKFVLQRYVDYLLEKRFPLEWYIEGGRSRSGKLRPPRLGMLAYVVESYRRGSTDDVVFIPVAIAYDQIQDVGAYAAELSGAGKERESLGWMVRTIRGLRLRYGGVHLRFGNPISLRAFLADQSASSEDVDADRDPAIPKLAFEVSSRINDATPVTPISLVTLALLSAGDRALTLPEVMRALEPFIDYVEHRSLPVTEILHRDDAARVTLALDNLARNGVVSRFDGATATVFRVGPEQHLAAAYYRNTVIHFFTDSAIAELALLHADEATDQVPAVQRIRHEALRLRDLLKFEFFFAATDPYWDRIQSELALHDPGWVNRVREGHTRTLLMSLRPFRSPAILRPFVEAYSVVGDLLERDADLGELSTDELAGAAMALGKQYHLQGRIRSPESVSSELFASALQLAANRGLLDESPDAAPRRRAFAADLRDVVYRLETLQALATASDAGLLSD